MILFTFVLQENIPKEEGDSLAVDESLFQRIGAGDNSALDELYHLTERALYAFCVSLTRDHELSREIMQETYLKVLSAAHLYKPMGKPLAWMFTIAKNIYYTEYKKRSRVQLEDTSLLGNDKRFSYVTDLEDRMVLEHVLSRLSEEEREIILLYAVSGMKHKEISESLGLKLSTVLSKYHRGLKKLRTYLEEGRS
ncbi:RNA polymerase sigma factor [Proteiniclasticum ruminis]|uniref:RNA polymerase sigma factor n=1 Tax=Proteiniclasticum ruminis TaxID=398199 RepID=UPI0028AFA150|nr:RNA polymerase sigma factor [Proteiniclasticum ruminis]